MFVPCALCGMRCAGCWVAAGAPDGMAACWHVQPSATPGCPASICLQQAFCTRAMGDKAELTARSNLSPRRFDRDLTVAGRVLVKEDGRMAHKLVRCA